MVRVKKVLLDVLKPHQPDALEFSKAIAEAGKDYKVCLTVTEMDENTQTLQLDVEGNVVDFDAIEAVITKLGGSIHSIDQVVTLNEGSDG